MEAIADDEALPFWNLMRPDEKAGIVVIGRDGPGEAEWRARMYERFGDAVRVDWGVSVELVGGDEARGLTLRAPGLGRGGRADRRRPSGEVSGDPRVRLRHR